MPSDFSRTVRRVLLIAAAVEIPLALGYYLVGIPVDARPGVLRLMLWSSQFPGLLLFDPLGVSWASSSESILRPSPLHLAVIAVVNGAVIALVAFMILRIRGALRPPRIALHA